MSAPTYEVAQREDGSFGLKCSDGRIIGTAKTEAEAQFGVDVATWMEERAARAAEVASPFLRLADEVINAPPMSDSYMGWLAEANDWMVVFSFAGKSITLGDLRKAASVAPVAEVVS